MNINEQKISQYNHTQAPFTASEDDSLLFYSNDPELIALYKELIEIPKEEAQREVDMLQSIVTKHSDEPFFAYCLANAYSNSNQGEMANQLTKNNYRRFPLSLLARCDYASLCLDENRPTEAVAAIDYVFDLEKLYPNRSAFHQTEIMAFYSFLIRYSCVLKNFDRAVHYIETLSLLTTADSPFIRSMSLIVMKNILEQKLSSERALLLLTNCSLNLLEDFLAHKSNTDKQSTESAQ